MKSYLRQKKATTDYHNRFTNFSEDRALDLGEDRVVTSGTMLDTGARLESVLNITKKDVNLTEKTILLKDMKGNETYTGFIATNLYNELIKYIDKLESNDYIVGCSNTKVTSIYIHRHLKPILDSLFNIGLEKDNRKQRVVIHTLRHTFASLLVINGTPIVTVKKLMNHKDIKTTMIYVHLAPDSGRQDVEGLF